MPSLLDLPPNEPVLTVFAISITLAINSSFNFRCRHIRHSLRHQQERLLAHLRANVLHRRTLPIAEPTIMRVICREHGMRHRFNVHSYSFTLSSAFLNNLNQALGPIGPITSSQEFGER